MEEKKKVFNTAKEYQENPLDFIAESFVHGTEKTILNQEAQGQKSFVESDTLPVEAGMLESDTKKNQTILESFGMKFLGPVEGDPLFQYVELPAGWKKTGSDHSMWSYIKDEKGRNRIGIFYKAAFYDRKAHYHLERRFSIEADYEQKEKNLCSIHHIYDGKTIVYSTASLKLPKEHGQAYFNICIETEMMAKKWLEEHYPDYMNPAAYWELEDLKCSS